MFDMMKMMGKVKEVQAKMKEAQEKLVHVVAEGESGGGMVKAKANGKHQVLSIEVDASLLKIEDKDMLQDLVVAAVNKALTEADEKGKEEIKKATEGLIPNIPGMDLGGFFYF